MVIGGVEYEPVRFKATVVMDRDKIAGCNTARGLLIEEIFGCRFYIKAEYEQGRNYKKETYSQG